MKALGARWGGRVQPDHNRCWVGQESVERESLADGVLQTSLVPLPSTTIVVHGKAPANVGTFMESLKDNRLIAERVVWLAAGQLPKGCVQQNAEQSALESVRALLEGRSDRYIAFVETSTALASGWLDELADAVEYGSEVVAATVVAEDASAPLEPCAADARCTLLNLRNVPLHVRFGDVDTIDGALVDFTWQSVRLGLGVRGIDSAGVRLGAAADDAAFAARYHLSHDELRRADVQRMESACTDDTCEAAMASIVMLSWNAHEYTKLAVESIRACTHSPYEIIIVDNGSEPKTLDVLRRLDGVRIISNVTNKGFAHGCNQGIAVSNGSHIVLLNNDVVVTEGWLENLLDAHRRDPLVGVSAPRSNCIAGHQQINPLRYDSMEAMHRFAANRSREFERRHYRTNRAVGFCLCIARTVIDEIGGLDTRYGIGNFEDDDFCIRVQAAGYKIVVCEDAFVHHFGSVSFTANNIDYQRQKELGWKIFAARWDLPGSRPDERYESASAIARGFVRLRDYVPLPAIHWPTEEEKAEAVPRKYAMAFVAIVDNEAAWSRIGPVVANYLKTLNVDDSSLFAIGVTGEADAGTIGSRIARCIDRLKLDAQTVPDIDVAEIEPSELDEWLAAIPAASRLRVARDDRLAELAVVQDRSPSGLLRTVRGKAG